MKLHNKSAEIFIPDSSPLDKAFERTTHLCIAAHHDDIEFMAYHGIINCFENKDNWFLGVILTNGSGSPCNSKYPNCSSDEIIQIRKTEQKKAAVLGKYSGVALLDYSSSEIKKYNNLNLIKEIKDILISCKPQYIYTHNLADKHETHVATALNTILALREISSIYQPKAIYGCEVWRGLDWLCSNNKILLDVSSSPDLLKNLIQIFESQVCNGKKYDDAVIGRQTANATFLDSHSLDQFAQITYAMDLMPLIKDSSLEIDKFIANYINDFKNDVTSKIQNFFK